MSRTNIDLDDEACEAVMRLYHLETKRDAVNFALRQLMVKPMTTEEILGLRGMWKDRPDSDFEELGLL
jgi:Arc/MetJ family transcription regulator